MRRIASISFLAALLAFIGCGSGSVVIISDTISPTPTVALDAGASQTFTATVTGDSTNSGVTWKLNGAGTLSNQTTTSVTYTAPAIVTAAGSANIEAIPVKNALYAAATQINYSAGPAITTTTLPTATVSSSYSAQLAESGGYGTLTWSIASGSLPTGLSLSSTGLISGTPTVVTSSTFTVKLTDSATTPAVVTQTLTLTVNAVKLTLGSANPPNGISGTNYSSQLTANGGVTPYTWTITGGSLPAGLTLSSSGLLSGKPTATGSFSFTVLVTDSETTPQTATATYSFLVYAPLTITTTTLPSGSIHNAYTTTTLQFTGGTLPLTWSLAAGSSLPAGLTLSSAGVISGTPTTVGNVSFTVQLKDSSSPQQTATATLSINIVLSTLAITTTTLPQATATVAYSQQLQSSGGNAPVTWSVASGSTLPSGLSLSSTGLLSGTPAFSTVGSDTFTVQATDATPATVSQPLTLNVVALATLTVSTATLPNGNIGTAYSSTIAATGGASPYTWTVSSGAVPQGLALSSGGVLSGTPVAAGSYTFTAKVTDSESTPANASRSFTVVIGTTLAVGANNAELSGSYGFLVNGFAAGNASGKTYGFASVGSLAMNGSGSITSGVIDTNASSGVQTAQSVTGSYTLGANNRGLMVLTVGSTTNVYAIAAGNVQSGVAQYIAITEFDNSAGTGNNGSGFAKLQTASAFTAGSVKGNYVFGLRGESPCNTCVTPAPKFGPVVAAGIFTADGTATLSAGSEDAGAYGASYSSITLAGSFTTPSATTGRGTLKLTPTGTLFSAPPTNYTYVIISANELLLLSNDSHATNALLYGDTELQQQSSYSATSLTGRAIGYESQANGGDGSVSYPAALNALLNEFTITGSGTATWLQDANRAGVFTAGTSSSITYTTASTGRTVITIGGTASEIVYLYNTNTGFGLDMAASTGYPGLVQFEQQVATAPLPPLFNGSYANGTLFAPVSAATASGLDAATIASGSGDSSIGGFLTTTLDSSTPVGSLTLGQATSVLYFEDLTGRSIVTPTTSSTTTLAVLDGITAKRAVSIPATSGTTPVVTVLQQ